MKVSQGVIDSLPQIEIRKGELLDQMEIVIDGVKLRGLKAFEVKGKYGELNEVTVTLQTCNLTLKPMHEPDEGE